MARAGTARPPGASASRWSASSPGLLIAATHGVSGGDEIRGSDAPRLVDLLREAQQSVDRLRCATRKAWPTEIDTHHGGLTGRGRRRWKAIQKRNTAPLPADAGLDPMRGPGVVVTLTDAQRDANGRFPRDASPDDLVVHQQDIQAVLNALWSGGAEGAPDAGSADHRNVGAAVRRKHSSAERPHLQPPVRHLRGRRSRSPCRQPLRPLSW